MSKIIFMRGIPGSGKTPWAMEQFDNDPKAVILSSADFFLDARGRYNWVAKKTPESHAWNQSRFQIALENGMETIVVDNTNIKAWEMQEYLNILENYPEYEVFQKVMEIDPEEAVYQSVHKVPLYALDRMDAEFEIIDTMEHYV
jgi:predicted kinase